MFETINSQVQQNQKAFQQALTDHLGRLTAMYDEVAKLEQKGLELAANAIDSSSAWVHQSLTAGEKARAEGRQVVTEATKKAADPATYGVSGPMADGLGALRTMAAEHATRVASCCDEVAKLEQASQVRAGEAVDEYARLVKESLRYGAALCAEWRKLTLEATKRTAAAVTPAD
jgi:hypothetical protein